MVRKKESPATDIPCIDAFACANYLFIQLHSRGCSPESHHFLGNDLKSFTKIRCKIFPFLNNVRGFFFYERFIMHFFDLTFAGSSLALRWLFAGSSLALRWLFGGSSMAFRWLFYTSLHYIQSICCRFCLPRGLFKLSNR